MGEWVSGARSMFWRGNTFNIFFLNPESYLDDCQAPLALTQFSLGWLLSESGLASDEASGFRDHYRESELLYLIRFHSWVLDGVAVFLLVAVGKVINTGDAFNNIGAFFNDVDGTVIFHLGCLR